jgi:hypothetical protein
MVAMERRNLAGLIFVAGGLLLSTVLDLPAALVWWWRLALCLAGLAFIAALAIGAFIDGREDRH